MFMLTKSSKIWRGSASAAKHSATMNSQMKNTRFAPNWCMIAVFLNGTFRAFSQEN
jgi:hypothetical protein